MKIMKRQPFSNQDIHLQKGVALAMMLWFIAALALLVAGMVSLARTDVRQVQLQLQQAQAAAAGDGASLLAMRDLLLLEEEGEFKGRGILDHRYTVGGLSVRIKALPSTGLVNLSRASPELLASVFELGAGLSEEQGQEIAKNIIVWRGPKPAEENETATNYENAGKTGPRYGQFETVEDLMQVLGVNRDIYERIENLLVASALGQVGIDPLSASSDVLAIVTGDADIAKEMITAREETPFKDNGIATEIPEEYVTQAVNALFRLDADVTMEDGKIYRRRRWVQRGGRGLDPLPWNILRSEPIKAISVGIKKEENGA